MGFSGEEPELGRCLKAHEVDGTCDIDADSDEMLKLIHFSLTNEIYEPAVCRC